MNGLNAARGVAESRPAWKRYELSLAYTVGPAVVLIAAAGLMLVGPRAVEWLAGQAGAGDLVVALWTWLRCPVAVLPLLLAAAVVYYVAPNVDLPFRLDTPDSVIAVVAWVKASLGFSFYVFRFGSYSASFGSLGGVVVLLLYFITASSALPLGAAVNANI